MTELTDSFNWPFSQLSLKDPNVWVLTPASTRIGGKNRDRMSPETIAAREKMTTLALGESMQLEGFTSAQIKKLLNNHHIYQARHRPADTNRLSVRYDKATSTATLTCIDKKKAFQYAST